MQNGCEVEWELMSLYGTALGDTLSVYDFAMSSDVKYGVLSNCPTVVPTTFLPVSASSSQLCCLQSARAALIKSVLSASTEILQKL